MSLRRSVRHPGLRHPGLRHLVLAACVALAAAVAGAPVAAVAAPPGSKNFTPPAYVPNYFSNEAQSFQGNATARAAQPGAGPVFAAPASRSTVAAASYGIGRNHAARAVKARGRVRLAHGNASAHRQFVHARVVHARLVHARVVHARAARSAKVAVLGAPGPRAAHAQRAPARSKTVAAKSRPAPGKGRGAARARG